MKTIKLLVVGNELISRMSLKLLLVGEDAFEVLAETGSQDAIHQAGKLFPDVVIVIADACLRNCLPLIASVRVAVPTIRVVVLGRETHPAYVGALIAAGVLGYIQPNTLPQELFNAIRAAGSGRRYIDPELSEALFELIAPSGTKALSRREDEVLKMVAYGYTPKEIASSLNISRKSIETYRARSREKLGLRTRSEIVQYALLTGAFDIEARPKWRLP
jgi:DNA-binding NarL/FixJ family response regulator